MNFLQRAVGWCETVGYIVLNHLGARRPKSFFEVSRPTRSFCVKGERIIQYEKPKSGIARPYLYFVGSSLWETGFFVFLREEKQIKCLLYKRKRKG